VRGLVSLTDDTAPEQGVPGWRRLWIVRVSSIIVATVVALASIVLSFMIPLKYEEGAPVHEGQRTEGMVHPCFLA